MRHDVAPPVTGCGRRLRALWPDRNPLRRAVDRVGGAGRPAGRPTFGYWWPRVRSAGAGEEFGDASGA
jgi:hypothetical protein